MRASPFTICCSGYLVVVRLHLQSRFQWWFVYADGLLMKTTGVTGPPFSEWRYNAFKLGALGCKSLLRDCGLRYSQLCVPQPGNPCGRHNYLPSHGNGSESRMLNIWLAEEVVDCVGCAMRNMTKESQRILLSRYSDQMLTYNIARELSISSSTYSRKQEKALC